MIPAIVISTSKVGDPTHPPTHPPHQSNPPVHLSLSIHLGDIHEYKLRITNTTKRANLVLNQTTHPPTHPPTHLYL